jgi:TrmH family RNA methyltransferase
MPPETIIRSRQNSIYKQIRSLLRRDRRHQERAFLVEGPRYIADAIRFGAKPVRIVLSESHADSVELPSDAALLFSVLDDELFASVSDTETSQGAIAVIPFPDLRPDPNKVPLVLVADGIQDPGNLGTLIRSAAGAGATQLVALPGAADPWAPKTARAAAAGHFLLPISTMTVGQLSSTLPPRAVILGADAEAPNSYDHMDLTSSTYIVIGSEGKGLSEPMRRLITARVAIPLDGRIESLNAAVAGSILLFEAARQRRK